jgi:imidazoleglycerol phosphate dehydratase HisB
MRTANLERRTRETSIRAQVTLDLPAGGSPQESEIDTGIGFLDHMLSAFALHAGLSLVLSCSGDRHVDDHHTAEDCALALGAVLDQAVGDRRGICRFGHAYAPLDEALARVVIDLSGRPSSHVSLELQRDSIGEIACENIEHFFSSLAVSVRASLHVDLIRGRNDHHKAEAAFKALALAFRHAVSLTGSANIPSTKGVL